MARPIKQVITAMVKTIENPEIRKVFMYDVMETFKDIDTAPPEKMGYRWVQLCELSREYLISSMESWSSLTLAILNGAEDYRKYIND